MKHQAVKMTQFAPIETRKRQARQSQNPFQKSFEASNKEMLSSI